jgi:hypothetical protein
MGLSIEMISDLLFSRELFIPNPGSPGTRKVRTCRSVAIAQVWEEKEKMSVVDLMDLWT